MARKSNKTEHVMKLITKDAGSQPDDAEEAGGAAGGPARGKAEPGAEGPARGKPKPAAAAAAAAAAEGVEATVSAPSGKELNYKTKLKIEIEPEIEIKEPPKARGPAKAGGSGRPGTAEAAGAEAAGRGAAEAPPDGTPYERIGKERLPDYSLELAAQRESIRDAGARRTKKIEIESSLISASRLVNLSELLTKELLPSVMERMEMCTCPMCTTNVLALTLNALPPKYVTSDEGKQYTQLEVYKSQYELDVLAAMTKACLRVKSSPRHEIIDDGIDRQ